MVVTEKSYQFQTAEDAYFDGRMGFVAGITIHDCPVLASDGHLKAFRDAWIAGFYFEQSRQRR
jgi:hypothetical protein